MSRPLQLTSWNHELKRRFPDLPAATVFVLALYSFGMTLAKVSGLSTVTLFLGKELGLSYDALRKRLSEFYKEAPAPADDRRGRDRARTRRGPVAGGTTGGRDAGDRGRRAARGAGDLVGRGPDRRGRPHRAGPRRVRRRFRGTAFHRRLTLSRPAADRRAQASAPRRTHSVGSRWRSPGTPRNARSAETSASAPAPSDADARTASNAPSDAWSA